MTAQRHCRDLEAMLSAYVDHEATADEMLIVETHAHMCRVRGATPALSGADAAARS